MSKQHRKFLSFVFPETTKKQIDAMPAEMKLRFYVFVTDYGMYDKEPEDLTDLEKLIWIPMKDLIDSCKSARGGAPEGNRNAKKTTETTQNKENNQNNVDLNKTTETTLNNDNGNHNGNGKVKGNHKSEANEIGQNNPENAGNPPPPPPILSEPQKEYSRVIFEKFRNAGLPCQKGDFFRFQACDFRLALQKLKGYGSGEVISAVDNYIFELKNPESYQLREYSFDNFVGSKTFSNCLPQNYRTQNFKKYAKEIPKGGGSPPDGDGKQHFYIGCPKCGQRLLEWDTPLQKYKCRSCGATLAWEEVEDGRNS